MDIEDEFLLKKFLFTYFWLSSLITHLVKNLPTMQEAQDQPLGREDPVEKEMATHSSTLAWNIPWTEEPSRLK